jgi:hypothetical protein
MTEDPFRLSRRAAVATGLAGALACAAGAAGARAAPGAAPTGHEHDWDWLVGDWTVRHRQRKGWLVGSDEWLEFGGTTRFWTTLGGLGNVDDNVIEKAGKTYRGMTVRAFDPTAGEWLIWWVDARGPMILDPPARGRFTDGVGTFLGDGTQNDKPVKLRLMWTRPTPATARWEQAFSPDGGASWEVNWIWELSRA